MGATGSLGGSVPAIDGGADEGLLARKHFVLGGSSKENSDAGGCSIEVGEGVGLTVDPELGDF